MNCSVAMIPGSFDPPTNGHLDIIVRASKLCEKLFVVIAKNPEKECLFSLEERKQMLEQLLAGYRNIKVCIWDGFVVDFASENNVNLIIRGLRNKEDFVYESELEKSYKSMMKTIEVMYLVAGPSYRDVSSTKIKKLAEEGKDISHLVPDHIASEILNKIKQLT